jgi:hypothetical protein
VSVGAHSKLTHLTALFTDMDREASLVQDLINYL